MAKNVREYSAFFEGISDFNKTGGPAAYANGRSVDHRTDTRSLALLPRTVKESGSVVTDLVKWIVYPPTSCDNSYLYGENGNLYQRDTNGVYSLLRTIASSHGNGMNWFGEDNYLYYTSDSLVGRYGPLCGSNPTFNDNFFGSQGGNPTNTNSLELLSASSQYASRASTSSLQIAGNLSISAQIYPYTLPTVGSPKTFVSKWDENGNLRSYKFDMIATSNYFGGGSDGALTISVDTTDAPIDSACTGTSGAYTLTATNASFAAGQIILIHQTQGTGAGTWQRNTIQSYTAGTITLVDALNATYTTGAQVLVVKQYTNVTVNSGKTWTAKAWDGTVGGILAFLANGTVTVTGTITATGKGYRGGTGRTTTGIAQYGEGTVGPAATASSASPNGTGGGAGNAAASIGPAQDGPGGSGGHATVGGSGNGNNAIWNGMGGLTSGTTDLTTMTFGGGGGGGVTHNVVNSGGNGGGILFISGTTITISGSVIAAGNPMNNYGIGADAFGVGGAGAGGSILLKCQTGTLGTNLITASGGLGYGDNTSPGGDGRVHIDYYTSYTGTTTPTLDYTQDPNLGATNGYELRLQLSNNGTAVETYAQTFTPVVNMWQQIGVVWTASTATAEFFLNGVSQGTQTQTNTTINQNASTFQVGMYKDGSSTAQGFYNGLIDEVQVFSVVRTAADFLLSISSEILTSTSGLQAYYQFNSVATDSTANANNLTLTGSPAYSTNVPFPGATTRLDIDTSQSTAGQTYTVPTSISETSANKLSFTPVNDPQKSIAVTIAAKGTGNWTLTVHDPFNNVVASKTVTNANLATGLYEFVFSTPWRIVINQTYHFHLTSTVADGTVTTGTTADLSTVNYKSYYAFLVTDTAFHPVAPMLQLLCFGNERYVATLQSTVYDPNAITLPAGWKVRCFGYWNEYLAIGAWRGSTIDQFESGRIFFWDGISLTYNFFIDVPEGAVNAMVGTKGRLFFMAGYRGKLLVYEGGAQARKIKNLINSDNTDVIDVYPGAMTMWRTLIRLGVAGEDTDPSVQRGVWTWGSVNDKYPDSLSFDYPISTGNYTASSVRIGAIQAIHNNLLISWQDNVSYGVDMVSWGNDVYPTGTVEFLIEDDDAMFHQKEAVTATAQFKPLVSGQSVTLKYKLDRNSDWTSFPTNSTVGATTERRVISLSGSRYREYELALDLGTSISTGPTILGVSLEKEMLEREKRVG